MYSLRISPFCPSCGNAKTSPMSPLPTYCTQAHAGTAMTAVLTSHSPSGCGWAPTSREASARFTGEARGSKIGSEAR